MMLIPITKPELAKLIEDEVSSGRFASAGDLVELAVIRFFEADCHEEFDDETIAAILRADAQCDRGEGIDFKDALLKLRRKYEQQ